MAETFGKSLEILGYICNRVISFFMSNPYLSDISISLAISAIAFVMGWFFVANRK